MTSKQIPIYTLIRSTSGGRNSYFLLGRILSLDSGHNLADYTLKETLTHPFIRKNDRIMLFYVLGLIQSMTVAHDTKATPGL